ncbi:MAG: lipid II:glycine glycyltransferase FemX [Propionibacteriaceae bacterium]
MTVMQLQLSPIENPIDFNQLSSSFTHTSALQSWGYGEAQRVLGYEPLRYCISDGEHTVGVVQLIRKKLAPGVTALYAPRGPVLQSPELLPDFAAAVRKIARSSDLKILIEPPLPRDALTESFDQIPTSIGSFLRTKAQQPEHTVVADLTRSIADMEADLSKMARRNIKTAEKLGVTVARDDDFDAFFALHTATNERAKLGAQPRAYYEALLKEGNNYDTECYLVLARSQGKALAGGMFLGFGSQTNYLFGGSIRDDRLNPDGTPYRDVKAPDAFYWHSLLDAKEHGYQQYDFWGLPASLDPSMHSYGVAQMKLKFAQQRLWYPGYSLTLSPLSPVIDRLQALNRKRINFQRRGSASDVV